MYGWQMSDVNILFVDRYWLLEVLVCICLEYTLDFVGIFFGVNIAEIIRGRA